MTSVEHGMIAVDKMGTKVLFLSPQTYATEVVIDGFLKTVHELLVVPETGFAAQRFAGGVGDSVAASRRGELVEAIDRDSVVPESLLRLHCRTEK